MAWRGRRAMKAMVLHEHGRPMIFEEVPIPEPGEGRFWYVSAPVDLASPSSGTVTGRIGRGGVSDKLPRIIGHEWPVM